MNRGTTTWTRICRDTGQVTSALSRRSALLIVGVLFAGFLVILIVAPPAIGFALTVALAIAWCVWLENHPERHPSGAPPAMTNKSLGHNCWCGSIPGGLNGIAYGQGAPDTATRRAAATQEPTATAQTLTSP
jgi:hypothetical protein